MNIVLALLIVAAQDRRPVPDPAALKEAEKLVKDIFKDDYAKGDRKSLAKNLLQQGCDTSDDLAAKYVLLREARDVAAQAGDIDTALRAIDALAGAFAVEAAAMKNAALATAARNAKTPGDFHDLAEAYAKVVDEAVARDEYDAADKAAKSALDCAKKAKDVALTTGLEARSKEVADLKVRFEKVKKAKVKLLSSPDDPASNSLLGFFLCAVKGDWESGLPRLAKGDDASLRTSAERDLADPSASADQAAAGDGWWDRAEKETGIARTTLRKRAAYWYEKAAAGLSGLAKTKVAKRLLELQKEKYKDGWEQVRDEVTLEAAPGQVEVEVIDLPSDDIDGVSGTLILRTGKDVHGLVVFGNDEWNVMVAMINLTVTIGKTEGARWAHVKEVAVTAREEFKITARLLAGDLVVYLDGQEKMRAKCPYATFPSIKLQADFGKVVFRDIRLHHK